MELTGWVGHDGVTDDMLLRGRQVQKMLRDPLSHMDNVQVSLLVARNRDTPLATRRKSSKPTGEVAISVKGTVSRPMRRR